MSYVKALLEIGKSPKGDRDRWGECECGESLVVGFRPEEASVICAACGRSRPAGDWPYERWRARRRLMALVEDVKAHAVAHYMDGGWDVIVECWDDSTIAEQIEGASTLAEAIKAFEPIVDVWADRQADSAY